MNAAANQVQPDGSDRETTASHAEESPRQDAQQSWFEEHFQSDDGWAEPPSESPLRPVVGGFLIFLAIAWTGIVAWAAGQAVGTGAQTAPELVRWAAAASGPLALIGLGWLLFGRSARNETVRFTRSVQAMRAESEALNAVLASIGQNIASNRTALAEETSRLMNLGEEAAGRLGAVTRDVDAGAQAMARYAEMLDRSAGSARTDMGVLLADLPKAEAQTRAMSELLRATGIDAHSQAGALEAQIAQLTARAREADEAAGGAAGRLTAHITQVDTAAAAATERMESATAAMSGGIDAALGKAAEAVDAARQGLEEQGNAMLAMVEQSSAAMDRAGVEAGHSLAGRVADIGGRIDALARQLAAQDEASQGIIGNIDRSLGGMETRFGALSLEGGKRLGALAGNVDSLTALADALIATMASGDAQIGDLTGRSEALKAVLADIGAELTSALPTGMDDIEQRTARSGEATARLLPQVAELMQATGAARAGLEEAATTAEARLDEAAGKAQLRLTQAEALVARQSAALETLLGKIDAGLEAMNAQVAGIGAAAVAADAQAEQLARDTGPQLIESLLRVRDAAMQASERAREAIAASIPEAAARLGEAAGEAMSGAITGQVAAQMTELGTLTEHAVEAARGASERLTRQMIAIGETVGKVEAHIAEAQDSLREKESEQFSRRVALLIESLNSTAIDVTKILSNEVTDSAWAAYLKGDRGVFTRRAVRLLEAGEAREIARHYEEEPEFREQVNRYIHDFEALLRRVLAERDGSPLGVTLLSSDMGKLYVALAQAIERLRG